MLLQFLSKQWQPQLQPTNGVERHLSRSAYRNPPADTLRHAIKTLLIAQQPPMMIEEIHPMRLHEQDFNSHTR